MGLSELLKELDKEEARLKNGLAAVQVAKAALGGATTVPTSRTVAGPVNEPHTNGHRKRRKCEHCKRGFLALRKNTRFCGTTCRWRYYSILKQQRKIPNKPFKAPVPAQSNQHNPHNRPRWPQQCKECGRTYEAERKDSRYCGKGCSQIVWRRKKRLAALDAKRIAEKGRVLVPGDPLRAKGADRLVP